MSIGVASVQQKDFITASAVYYCEQRFATKSAVVVVAVVGQASWPNVWPQRVWNSIWVLEHCLISGSLEHCLILGTLEQQWLNSGQKSATVSICRNSTILKYYHQWIYKYMCPYNSSMSIVNIQYFHNQRRWRIAVKQIQLGSTNVSDVNQGWML